MLAVVMMLALCLAGTPAVGAETHDALIREGEVEALFSGYCSRYDLDPNLISVSYLYTATGEMWNHLEDRWYYSASLYKVPLMMLLTEREHDGELNADSEINGVALADIEEEVLVQSNNPIAYSTLLWFGQPDVTRRLFCRYADLPEDYYTWDFYGGSYFTARFMTEVMDTLFREPERFPRMIDCLERAQLDHYFRLRLGDRYDIAQKYGTYQDEDANEWNHATGIIYTPHPFVLTVMTRYGGISETILGDLAVLFEEYTLTLDKRLEESEKADTQDVLEYLQQKPTGTDVRESTDLSANQEEYAPVQQVMDSASESRQDDRERVIIAGVSAEVFLIAALIATGRRKRRKRPASSASSERRRMH